tara:strand:+ start:109 stop:435 length:327 start_codon:yes stop_codon:yes gene_type:complete
MEDLLAQMAMTKTITDCCALCQLSRVSNDTPINTINTRLTQLRQEMEANVEVGVTRGNGQTAVFTVVSPGEHVLEDNLKLLGFEQVHTFPRRRGYPETGALKLMIKNL